MNCARLRPCSTGHRALSQLNSSAFYVNSSMCPAFFVFIGKSFFLVFKGLLPASRMQLFLCVWKLSLILWLNIEKRGCFRVQSCVNRLPKVEER